MSTLTGEELLAYNSRRERIVEVLAKHPRGTQQQVSYDIRKPATMVSLVLNGRYVQEEILILIEEWLVAHPAVETVSA